MPVVRVLGRTLQPSLTLEMLIIRCRPSQEDLTALLTSSANHSLTRCRVSVIVKMSTSYMCCELVIVLKITNKSAA